MLQRRAAGLERPLQMCDALSRNQLKESETDLCYCILHGRRNFVDLLENFPQECLKVMESLREIYRGEAQAKEQQLSPADRRAFHQAQSGPVMQELHQWMKDQLDHKKVEPNSGLGQALRYMLKHWVALTRFLKVPGAPLDNNICQRALKMAILHRENSMSYKTLRGARVGDIFMSLIHTCQLNRVNPFDYLMALQQHPPARSLRGGAGCRSPRPSQLLASVELPPGPGTLRHRLILFAPHSLSSRPRTQRLPEAQRATFPIFAIPHAYQSNTDYLLSLPIRSNQPDAPLFPALSKKKGTGRNELSITFSRLMEKAGVVREAATERVKGKGRQVFTLGFHSFRHTAISALANAGVSKELRMKLSGHKSNVHESYTHHELETMRSAVERVKSFVKPEPQSNSPQPE